MTSYLAKSYPVETIQEHTNNLIDNFHIIKNLYPNLKINWDILYLACLHHDIGKINKKFQDKIKTGKIQKDEIPHGILSLAFVNTKELKEKGYSKSDIIILAHAIAYHHERDFSYDNKKLEREIDLLKKETSNFYYEKIQNLKVKKISSKYFHKNRIYQEDNEEQFFNYIMVKGLLNRIDYAASSYIDVEIINNFLLNDLNNMVIKWKKNNISDGWNDLQKHMLANSNENIIVIADTGMGKTEAGLLWIGNNKGFFTLPLKTAINAMYERITKKIIKDDFENKVGLLHSDTYSELLNQDMDNLNIDEYYNKTKQFSLPLTVCTLDQIFDFVFRYRGFELKLATLAYSKIVIDEVQMYSSDLLAYLIIGLSYINKIGGKFAILTATLPGLVEDLLKDEGIQYMAPKTFTNNHRIRHSVKLMKKIINKEDILKLYRSNKILVICNTVKQAQKLYKELNNSTDKENINLLHSNFIKKDRKQKENKILEMGNQDSKEQGIWVTTQVVEASLDIDFDILITELSDINGLFQRMGRCYRNRSFDKDGYNCYVFDGGEKECSGIGYVIDRDIFSLSKKALQNIDGKLKETEKMQLVKSLYSKENLKDTKYYKRIKDNIKYVKSIEDYEKSKSEINKMFRNINSITVIPDSIYTNNYKEIEENLNILSQNNRFSNYEEVKKFKVRKTKARNNIMQFTVNVPYYRVDFNNINSITFNKNESIYILECNYSEEKGLEFIENSKKTKQLDNFI